MNLIAHLEKLGKVNWDDKNTNKLNYDELLSFYSLNINTGFARISNREITDTLKQFPINIIKNLRNDLSIQLLKKYKSSGLYSLRTKSSINTLTNDIYLITQYLVATSITDDEISNIYNKKTNLNNTTINPEKNDLEDICTRMEEMQFDLNIITNNNDSIKTSQTVQFNLIKDQTKHINNLTTENHNLKLLIEANQTKMHSLEQTINKLVDLISNQTSNTIQSLIPSSNDNQIDSLSQYPSLPSPAGPINAFFQRQNSIQSTNSPTSNKRNASTAFNPTPQYSSQYNVKVKQARTQENTLTNNGANNQATNSNLNNCTRVQSNKQSVLANFDSSNPDLPNTKISQNYNDTFRVAGPRQRNKQSFTNSYIKSAGTGNINGIKTCDRKIDVYLGRIDIDEDNKNVENFLHKFLKISNFTQIKTEHSLFKSFKFSISILDKDIINKKELWPKGTIINQFRRPYSERTHHFAIPLSQHKANDPRETILNENIHISHQPVNNISTDKSIFSNLSDEMEQGKQTNE